MRCQTAKAPDTKRRSPTRQKTLNVELLNKEEKETFRKILTKTHHENCDHNVAEQLRTWDISPFLQLLTELSEGMEKKNSAHKMGIWFEL